MQNYWEQDTITPETELLEQDTITPETNVKFLTHQVSVSLLQVKSKQISQLQ